MSKQEEKRDFDKEAEELKRKVKKTLEKFQAFCDEIADKKDKKAA